LKKKVALHLVQVLKNPSVQAEQELKQVSQILGVTPEFFQYPTLQVPVQVEENKNRPVSQS